MKWSVSMKTMLSQAGDVTVVHVSGRLNIDHAGVFRKACLNQLSNKKIVFNLSELSFVGSTGIQSFFQIVQELHNLNTQAVKIVGMHQDFQRIYQMSQATAPCMNHLHDALVSFQNISAEFIEPVRIS